MYSQGWAIIHHKLGSHRFGSSSVPQLNQGVKPIRLEPQSFARVLTKGQRPYKGINTCYKYTVILAIFTQGWCVLLRDKATHNFLRWNGFQFRKMAAFLKDDYTIPGMELFQARKEMISTIHLYLPKNYLTFTWCFPGLYLWFQ